MEQELVVIQSLNQIKMESQWFSVVTRSGWTRSGKTT
ncbi:hypothetical protein RBSH_00406 [Rhodopirellula baltica SH28]|uniref:Uncharacterized protein n=1 Tax=Rhodopirellula baltica SH28 TaxID=993517 RepID=K5EEA9_RHOBT|nr:hypothetical protein RBSH_00406 [Rhodopirellula baltica SH28]